MIVTAYKTHKIDIGEDVFTILDTYLPELKENTIVCIASKIIALCQKNVIKKAPGEDKQKLIQQESDFYLGKEYPMPYGQKISIKNHTLIASGGIDESNGNGYYILWPTNVQETTNKIWAYLRKKNEIKNVGIVITDSRVTPLRWGVIGIALSWCGFAPVKNYIGEPDIYSRIMEAEKTSIIDSLATTATLITGEGNEQTPIAVMEDVDFIQYQNRVPTEEEIKGIQLKMEEDLFEPLLTSVNWKKGKKAR